MLGLAAAAISFGTVSSNAATISWDGGTAGGGTVWTSGSNWMGDVVPVITDSVAFGLATTKTISLGASQTVNELIFNGASAAFTIGNAADISSGNALTLTNVTRSASPTVAQTIAANVVLANNSTWNIGAGAGTFKVSGAISGASKSLTKIGSGTLVLAGTNTYTGATAVNQGTLVLDFANMATPTNIVSTSSTLTLGGGTLQVKQQSGVATSQTFANTTVNAGASSIIGTSVSTGGLTVALGTISRAGGNGTSGGTLNFTIPTTGSITASNSNDASGILGTWATIGATTTLQYATVSSGTIASYTGATAATAADLSNVTSATTNYSFGAAATQTGAVTANTLRYTGGAATLANGGTSTTLNGLMNAGTGLLTINGIGKLVIGANRELVIQSNGQGITIASTIADNAGGKSALTYNGGGTLTFSASNSYTGDTTVLAGTLNPNNNFINGNLIVGSMGGGTGAATFGNGTASTTFNPNKTSNVTVYSNGTAYLLGTGNGWANNLTIVGGTASLGGSFYMGGAVNMTGGTITGQYIYGSFASGFKVTTNASDTTATLASGNAGWIGTASTYTVADGSAAIDLNVTGLINSGYATQGITKSGAGVMAVGVANVFTGATTVNAGTLLLTNSNALQNSPLANGGTGIVFDSSVASHAFKIGGLNGSGNLALQDNAGSPNAVALTLNANASRSYSGSLSGAGSVIKIGSSIQTFTGANNYSGGTTVTSGTLALSGAGTFGTGSVSVTGGVLDLGAKSITNTLGAVTGGGAVNNGTITNDSSNYDLQNGSVGAVLAGSNGLNKTTANTVVLTASNSFTGNTTVTGGTLALQGSGSINNSPVIDVQSGAVLNLGALSSFTVGATQTLQGVGTVTGPTAGALVVSGTLVPAGATIGTLAVSGNLTLEGTTVVDLDKTGTTLTSDLVSGATTFTLGGALTVNLTGDALVENDSFLLFSGGTITGSFSSFNLPTIDSGLAWDTTHLAIDGQLLVVAVPEPATWAMMLGGLGLLAFGKRLRRLTS